MSHDEAEAAGNAGSAHPLDVPHDISGPGSHDFETSVQARFLIPMAISLGFGILYATFIILLMVPVLYSIAEQVREFYGTNPRVKRPQSSPQADWNPDEAPA